MLFRSPIPSMPMHPRLCDNFPSTFFVYSTIRTAGVPQQAGEVAPADTISNSEDSFDTCGRGKGETGPTGFFQDWLNPVICAGAGPGRWYPGHNRFSALSCGITKKSADRLHAGTRVTSQESRIPNSGSVVHVSQTALGDWIAPVSITASPGDGVSGISTSVWMI